MAATKMNGKPKCKEEIVGKAATSGYQPIDMRWYRRPRDLPMLTWIIIEQMMMEPTIRLGLAMRAAPLMGVQFAYKEPGDKEWQEGIRANSPIVGEFVRRQLKTIWRDLDALLTAQIWGWAAAEVMYHLTDHGTVEISRLLPRHPRDCRALVREGDICGARFNRIVDNERGHIDLYFPKCIFHRHQPQSGHYYGLTILEGCYSPFYDKWGNGGALDSRRLCMQQNAMNGRRLMYPDGFTELPIGENGATIEVPNRDIARQIVEQIMSGAVVTLPSTRDASGNPYWELVEASAMQGIQHLLQYPKDLDVEILRGMEIPDDIITAEATGAWEGKKVPMMAFYGGLDLWLGNLKRDIVGQILKPLVLMNFGRSAWFEVETKPLAEQAMEAAKGDTAQTPPPQGIMGAMPFNDREGYSRMSLDPVEAVGRGVMDAASVVKAARVALGGEHEPQREVSFEQAVRMALEARPTQPATIIQVADETGAMAKAIGQDLREAVKESFAALPPPPVPQVTVNPTPVHVEAPIVNVPAAVVNVPAPIVQVPPQPEYDIEPVIDPQTRRAVRYKRVPKQ